MKPITLILDEYCLSRNRNDTKRQLEIANTLVDILIPDLIERLGETTIQRNALSKTAALQAAIDEEESHG